MSYLASIITPYEQYEVAKAQAELAITTTWMNRFLAGFITSITAWRDA